MVVIFGGRSEIGVELALRLARGATVVLAARRRTDSTSRSRPRRRAPRGARRGVRRRRLASHGPLLDRLVAEHGPIGTAVLASGCSATSPRRDRRRARRRDRAHRLRRAGQPADPAGRADARGRRGRSWCSRRSPGVRVRRANYVYGSAKAGLDGFASGLGRRAARHRGASADRAARVRHRPDDRGHGPRAVVQHARAGGRRRRAGAGRGRRRSGCRGRSVRWLSRRRSSRRPCGEGCRDERHRGRYRCRRDGRAGAGVARRIAGPQ